MVLTINVFQFEVKWSLTQRENKEQNQCFDFRKSSKPFPKSVQLYQLHELKH